MKRKMQQIHDEFMAALNAGNVKTADKIFDKEWLPRTIKEKAQIDQVTVEMAKAYGAAVARLGYVNASQFQKHYNCRCWATLPDFECANYEPKEDDGWLPIDRIGEFEAFTDLWGYFEDGTIQDGHASCFVRDLFYHTQNESIMGWIWIENHQPLYIKLRTDGNKPEPPKACQTIRVGDKVKLKSIGGMYWEVTGIDDECYPYQLELIDGRRHFTRAKREELVKA